LFAPRQAAALLKAALAAGPAGSTRLQWSAAMAAVFTAVKEAVATACKLQHLAPGAKPAMATDASASHIGAMLQQWVTGGGGWKPLAFYLAKLTAAQSKYSAFDLKLLAIYLSIRHFRFMLEERSFTMFTDHWLLLGNLSRVSDPWSARQCRQQSIIAEFAATLRLISGGSVILFIRSVFIRSLFIRSLFIRSLFIRSFFIRLTFYTVHFLYGSFFIRFTFYMVIFYTVIFYTVQFYEKLKVYKLVFQIVNVKPMRTQEICHI
jgi:RNase H-like domain found in reverse transcriptase